MRSWNWLVDGYEREQDEEYRRKKEAVNDDWEDRWEPGED